jgi:hypothetical protein
LPRERAKQPAHDSKKNNARQQLGAAVHPALADEQQAGCPQCDATDERARAASPACQLTAANPTGVRPTFTVESFTQWRRPSCVASDV